MKNQYFIQELETKRQILEDMQKNHISTYIKLGSPNNMAELIDNLNKIIVECKDEDPLPFLMRLSNARITLRFIHSLIWTRESLYSNKKVKSECYDMVCAYDELVKKADKYNYRKYRSITNILIDRVNHMESREEITALLDQCNFDRQSFTKMFDVSISHYVYNYRAHIDDEYVYPETLDTNVKGYNFELENSLKNKLEFYRERIIENKKDDEKAFEIECLYDAYKTISDYISSDLPNIQDFCMSRQMDTEDFYYDLSLIKKHSPKDYEDYQNYINKSRSERFVRLVGAARLLIKDIRNKVTLPDGRKRDFDAIDFYMKYRSFVDQEENLFRLIEKELGSNEVVTLKQFFEKYFRKSNTNVDQVAYNLTYKYMDNGVVKELSNEEKTMIISYLNRLNIPFNQITYSLMVKRYISHEITLDKKSIVTEEAKPTEESGQFTM